MNFAMVGEAVNTAHRLVDMAEDGQIVLTEVIYDALRARAPRMLDVLRFESLGEIEIRGKAHTQLLYHVQMERTPLENPEPSH